MRRDARAVYDRALEAARSAAFPPGEFVGQESFMRRSEILALARRAGIGPATAVLDLCCGVAGPGRLIARELGCAYTGVDASAGAIDVARRRAAGLSCTFEVAHVPPVPGGRYDVVLLLETALALPDKAALVRGVAEVLVAGGRFALTLEEGMPLTAHERDLMPHADTVSLLPLGELLALLREAGMRVDWQHECSRSHLATVTALLSAFEVHAPDITARLGRQALDDLVASHRLWRDWLAQGRVRKFALVATKQALPPGCFSSARRSAPLEGTGERRDLRGEDVELVVSRRPLTRDRVPASPAG